jgi:hypothetical protein
MDNKMKRNFPLSSDKFTYKNYYFIHKKKRKKREIMANKGDIKTAFTDAYLKLFMSSNNCFNCSFY